MKRVLKELQITRIAAVDRPCQEHATCTILKRDFSDDKRKEMADKGSAMPDGSYPIANTADLHNAIRAIGRAKDPAATKRHIITRARALGATSSLPDSWNIGKIDALRKRMDDLNRELLLKRLGICKELLKGGPGSGPRPGQGRVSATEPEDIRHLSQSIADDMNMHFEPNLDAKPGPGIYAALESALRNAVASGKIKTTFALAKQDRVKKGGPGSGPRPGAGRSLMDRIRGRNKYGADTGDGIDIPREDVSAGEGIDIPREDIGKPQRTVPYQGKDYKGIDIPIEHHESERMVRLKKRLKKLKAAKATA